MLSKIPPIALAVFALFLAGCTTVHTNISHSYDFNKVRRIAVAPFATQSIALDGIEDLISEYFLQDSFVLVERTHLSKLLDEYKLGEQGYLDPATIKKVGHLLGVDLLIIGDASYYPGQLVSTPVTVSEHVINEPVYTDERITHQDGTVEITRRQSGTETHHYATRSGGDYTTQPSLRVTAKLVDVETGEIVWAGSGSSSGTDIGGILQDIVGSLVKKLNNDLRTVKAQRY